jgi:hypothetical protein
MSSPAQRKFSMEKWFHWFLLKKPPNESWHFSSTSVINAQFLVILSLRLWHWLCQVLKQNIKINIHTNTYISNQYALKMWVLCSFLVGRIYK